MNPIRRIIAATAITLALTFSALAQSLNADKSIDLIWGVKIPMRDGVKLNATVFKPQHQTAPLPVIFTFTPYISDTYQDRAVYFAKNGYVYALIDVRGRGNSEGKFEPFVNEARDGRDAVEWLATQSWSNGRIAMWGGSYAGFDQWTTLKEAPPHLATIVPAAAAYPGVDFPAFKNIFSSYVIQWLSYTSGVTPNLKLFGESSFWTDKFHQLYAEHRPFKELDKVVGNTSTHFQTWLAHPIPDAYWQAMVPTPDQYRRMNIPILTITGHYDGDQNGAMQYYREHMKYGSPEARDHHYLIIGPWDHAGTRTPSREVGGLKFGEASMLDLNKLHKEWYDWTMKSGPKPEFLKKRVAYYVVGADQWKYADSLEAIANSKLTYYLGSDGEANDVFHSGTLSTTSPDPDASSTAGSSSRANQPTSNAAASDRLVYDPLDTRPGELDLEEVRDYITSQRDALNLNGNGVVYHSEPFTADTEVSGYLKFVAWMSMDVPDTDFQVAVYEIKRDGTSVYLTSDQMRARYRESLTKEKLVKPGEINRYEFNAFQFFSRRIAKGSRLRLILSCPNTIQLEKNYNSGGVVAEESRKDARTAHITVYHDASHRSFLEVPVAK
ncbi:MAG TPA: CocE/NonD family hydrolase [Blastocatellia bacterium]|nr:CocE/NonD family hydrolase [Blastocatellia bacterium]